MSVLERIVATKREEIARLRSWRGALEAGLGDAPSPRDFAAALRRDDEVAVIAEVKRRSPGAGEIRPGLDPAGLAATYREGGAAALSVLTDREYFDGSLDDLRAVRDAVDLPILRKDFVLDDVQLVEARAAGADAVLLIVRILTEEELGSLLGRAEELGLAALVEVHDREELSRALDAGARVVGVNNRDLATFEVSLEVTAELAIHLPADALLVSESGIASGGDVERVGGAGADAVLVGEALLRAPDPGAAVSELVGRSRVGRADA